ncbi:hypothetical protein [Kitasatospora sp. NPDC059571]|uniref:hypothetical protein n=1 Tax=Kitasatospora sp. NPDC059571 TaxID=3346871 RepID=UPI0036A0CA5A
MAALFRLLAALDLTGVALHPRGRVGRQATARTAPGPIWDCYGSGTRSNQVWTLR